MSKLLKDARQIGLRRFLEQIGNRTHHEGTADAKPAGVSELDNLLDSIDMDLTQPLRMDASNPADLVVSVGPAIVTNTETNRNKTIPHVGRLLPNDFTSGTVTFPASSGGNIVLSPGINSVLTVPSNEYVKVLIYMDVNGDLNALPGETNAVEATASVLPPPNNTLPLGYITLFNNAGTIDPVAQSDIYQFGNGAGGGGAGDANELIERLADQQALGPYEFVGYNVFALDEDDKVDVGNSTGEFSVANAYFELLSGQTMTSIQMLDDDFLNPSDPNTDPQDVTELELTVFWDLANIDNAATYEVSRMGGQASTWQAVTMEGFGDSETYRGVHTFTDEGVTDTLDSYTGGTPDTLDFQDVTAVAYSTKYTVTNTEVVTNFRFYVDKLGSPTGKYKVQIIADDTTLPSTSAGDVLAESALQDIASLSAGASVVDVAIPATALAAGNYHIAIFTDDEYKAAYSNGVDEIRIRTDNAGGGNDIEVFNGTTWSTTAGTTMLFEVEGRVLDLRLRVTSSQDSGLAGYGLFYGGTAGEVTGRDSELLTENRLGSTDPVLDRSVAGEGILLRADNGQLVEASIEWTGTEYRWVFSEVN